jgi:hypothetical protein
MSKIRDVLVLELFTKDQEWQLALDEASSSGDVVEGAAKLCRRAP